MKKTYRIDSRFYFLLIIFYLKNNHKKEVFAHMTHIMNLYKKSSAIKNFADNYDFLDEKKLASLLKKVSFGVTKNNFYYANLCDVLLMLQSYGFAKNLVSGCTVENILNEELKKHTLDKRNFANYIEERNFELVYLRREKRNLGFYLQHAEKRAHK